MHIQIRTDSDKKADSMKKIIREGISGVSEQFIDDFVVLDDKFKINSYVHKWLNNGLVSNILLFIFLLGFCEKKIFK